MSCALELSPATPPFSWTKGRGGRSAFRWMTGTKFNLLFKYIYVSWFYGRSTATQGRSCDDWRFFLDWRLRGIGLISMTWPLSGCLDAGICILPTDQPTNRPTDWLCDWQGIFISQLLKQRHLSWSPLLVFLFAFACFNKRLPSGFHLQAKFSISPWLRQGIFFVFGRDLGPCTLINRRV